MSSPAVHCTVAALFGRENTGRMLRRATKTFKLCRLQSFEAPDEGSRSRVPVGRLKNMLTISEF